MSDQSENEENQEPIHHIPIDREIGESLLEMLLDQGVRVDKLRETISHDPVLLLEIITAANQLKNVAQGPGLLDTKSALLALGLQQIKEVVEMMLSNTPVFTDEKTKWLKVIRTKSRKIGSVASIIANSVKPAITLDCFVVGSFASYGDLIAVAEIGNPYIALLNEGMRRSKLKYRVSQDFKFRLEEVACDYFKLRNLPDVISLVLDPESSKLSPDDQMMKAICFSAVEFVDAHLEERFDRLSPDHTIPPKSYRRMLQVSDEEYKAIYEQVQSFLVKGEIVTEEAVEEVSEVLTEEGSGIRDTGDSNGGLEVAGSDAEEESTLSEIVDLVDGDDFEYREAGQEGAESKIVEIDDEPAHEIETVPRRKYVSKSDKALPMFIDMFEDTASTDVLLEKLLGMLVGEGPFECAALVVVNADERKAWPVMSRGRELFSREAGYIELTDSLSPLLNMKSKVVSYSPRGKKNAPFGCGNYALSPLEVTHELPVALYADCGEGKILTFESRRLFRKVVDILNNILPNMEGSIPMEGQAP